MANMIMGETPSRLYKQHSNFKNLCVWSYQKDVNVSSVKNMVTRGALRYAGVHIREQRFCNIPLNQWRNSRRGGGGGRVPPPPPPILLENQKREGGKLEMEGWKVTSYKMRRGLFFFFFFAFHFSKPQKFVLGLPKGEFSTGKGHFTPRRKIRKNDFAPSEKYSSNASALNMWWKKNYP